MFGTVLYKMLAAFKKNFCSLVLWRKYLCNSKVVLGPIEIAAKILEKTLVEIFKKVFRISFFVRIKFKNFHGYGFTLYLDIVKISQVVFRYVCKIPAVFRIGAP